MRSPQGDVVATYERKYERYNVNFSTGTYLLENDELPEVIPNVEQENPDLDDDRVVGYAPGTTPGVVAGQTPTELNPASSGGDLAEVIELKELHLYGNRRLGYKSENKIIHLTFFTPEFSTGEFGGQDVDYHTDITPMYAYQHRMLGRKYYEQTNHLGNVLTVVTDRKIPVEGNTGQVAHYEAQVVKATDYYPFGMEMGGRSFSADLYRYGFNGKEGDREGWGGQLVQDYGFRLYNPAIGKFLSADPLASSYPWYTPYQFAGNKPIVAIDLDGLEEYHYMLAFDEEGNSTLRLLWVEDIVDEMSLFSRHGEKTKTEVVNARQKFIRHAEKSYYSQIDHQTHTNLEEDEFSSFEELENNSNNNFEGISYKRGLADAIAYNSLYGGIGSIKFGSFRRYSKKGKNKPEVPIINSSNPKRQRRIEVASKFFKENLKIGNLQINRMLRSAIDFNRGVRPVDLKKGTIIFRYERIGKENETKHFFADRFTVAQGPNAVGLSSNGYQLKAYEIKTDIKALNTAIQGSRGQFRQLIFNGV